MTRAVVFRSCLPTSPRIFRTEHGKCQNRGRHPAPSTVDERRGSGPRLSRTESRTLRHFRGPPRFFGSAVRFPWVASSRCRRCSPRKCHRLLSPPLPDAVSGATTHERASEQPGQVFRQPPGCPVTGSVRCDRALIVVVSDARARLRREMAEPPPILLATHRAAFAAGGGTVTDVERNHAGAPGVRWEGGLAAWVPGASMSQGLVGRAVIEDVGTPERGRAAACPA